MRLVRMNVSYRMHLLIHSFIDPTEVMEELGYEEDDVDAAIERTLEIIAKEYE